MSECFEKARELGAMILSSGEYKRLSKAEAELAQDINAQKKISEFKTLQEKTAAEIGGGTLSPAEADNMADKLKIKYAELSAEPSFRKKTEAAAEYERLVNSVMDILNLTIGRSISESHCQGCGRKCEK